MRIPFTRIIMFMLVFEVDVWVEEVVFEKIREGIMIGDTDQQGLVDFLQTKEGIFFLFRFHRTHQGDIGESIYYFRITDDLLDIENNSISSARLIYWQFTQQESSNPEGLIRIDLIPREQWLQGRIVRIGDLIHFPDNDNHSLQFSLTGEYLGRFPGFSELEPPVNGKINVEGVLKEFPLELFGNTYSDYFEAGPCYILISESLCTSVRIADLRKNGSEATHENIILDESTRVLPFYKHYFAMVQYSKELQLYQTSQERLITRVQMSNPPRYGYIPFSFYIDDSILFELMFTYPPILLNIYYISGIEETSSISAIHWYQLK